MGKDNRSRRTAKQKDRSERLRAKRRADAGWSRRPVSAEEAAETLILSAVGALGCSDHDECRETADQAVAALVDEGDEDWPRAVDTTLFRLLMSVLTDKCWPEGWQPADLARVATRELGAEARRAAADLMAAQLRSYAPATIDAVWHDQLAELKAEVWWPDDASYVTSLATARSLGRADAVGTLARLLGLFAQLPALEMLMPPPGKARNVDAARSDGSDGSGGRSAGGVNDKLLARVRALLAKAESTTFEAEAETFTAAAQAMMARHSIDQAVLDQSDDHDADRPGGIRLGVENPYPEAKAVLLQQIAEANRCRAVWSKHLGFTTVLGYRADTAWVELLYTSLLVQATAAMTKAGSKTTARGTSRTRAFRSSFLESFAARIGERLRHETQEAETAAAASAGRDLLPVLARRDQAVEDEVRRIFPDMTNSRRASWAADREGWAAGRTAADLADLARAGTIGSGARDA
jgi:hypothetical protein